MELPQRVLCIIIIPVIIFIATEGVSRANDDWQLNDTPPEMTDDEEAALGKQVDDYIRYQFYVEDDPEFNEAVDNIVQKVAAVSDRNAFSAPGGYIYLTYGLLKFAQTEDEVAGIVGHEVAHASLRHASKLYHEIMEILSHQDKGIDDAASLLLLNSHLEEFEQDADTTGVFYAHKAGFNPTGLLDFLERHFALLMRRRMFGMPSYGATAMIGTRLNHLREYISNLEKKLGYYRHIFLQQHYNPSFLRQSKDTETLRFYPL